MDMNEKLMRPLNFGGKSRKEKLLLQQVNQSSTQVPL